MLVTSAALDISPGGCCLVLLHALVLLTHPSHRHEHQHSVTAAAQIVGREAVPQGEHPLSLGHSSDGLEGPAVG